MMLTLRIICRNEVLPFMLQKNAEDLTNDMELKIDSTCAMHMARNSVNGKIAIGTKELVKQIHFPFYMSLLVLTIQPLYSVTVNCVHFYGLVNINKTFFRLE